VKIRNTLNAVENLLGLPTSVGFFRKFLVKKTGSAFDPHNVLKNLPADVSVTET
jgi:hypothetical protein